MTDDLAHAVAAKDPQVRDLAGGDVDILCRLMDMPMAGLDGLAEAIGGLRKDLPDTARHMLEDLLHVGQLIRGLQILPR